jgi:hypothetical protein
LASAFYALNFSAAAFFSTTAFSLAALFSVATVSLSAAAAFLAAACKSSDVLKLEPEGSDFFVDFVEILEGAAVFVTAGAHGLDATGPSIPENGAERIKPRATAPTPNKLYGGETTKK